MKHAATDSEKHSNLYRKPIGLSGPSNFLPIFKFFVHFCFFGNLLNFELSLHYWFYQNQHTEFSHFFFGRWERNRNRFDPRVYLIGVWYTGDITWDSHWRILLLPLFFILIQHITFFMIWLKTESPCSKMLDVMLKYINMIFFFFLNWNEWWQNDA